MIYPLSIHKCRTLTLHPFHPDFTEPDFAFAPFSDQQIVGVFF
jgi:hypothetical protein